MKDIEFDDRTNLQKKLNISSGAWFGMLLLPVFFIVESVPRLLFSHALFHDISWNDYYLSKEFWNALFGFVISMSVAYVIIRYLAKKKTEKKQKAPEQ